MKTKHLAGVLLGLATLALFASDASAMYNPSTGTWMQRDPGPGGMVGSPRLGTAGPVAGGAFVSRDEYADGMTLYQYVGSEPIGWVDVSGRGRQRAGSSSGGPDVDPNFVGPPEPLSGKDKDKPGDPSAPAPGTPDFVGPPEPPAGRLATCGIRIYRSAICTLSPKKKSDFGHEWINDGSTTWDFPYNYFDDPVAPCRKYDKENPVWIWNAHVRPFGGTLPNGTPCGKASCRQIKVCLQDAENEWRRTTYEFWGHNCIDFAAFALKKCCMEKGCCATRIPGWGEEKKKCCEREKEMDRLGCNSNHGGP